MNDLLHVLADWSTDVRWARWLQAIFIVVVGVLLGRMFARAGGRIIERHASAQAAMVVRRLTTWLASSIALVTALKHLGFDLSVLLGAAGVLTVALGFAAQTSASNLISGLFLMGERPFVVGDFIEVDSVQGDVISVDWLSVKLRTVNNLLVRIPNETMVKARVTNYTRHPLRRVDVEFTVVFGTDLDRLRQVLLVEVDHNPLSFDEPAPMVQFLAFIEGSVQGRLCVWVLRQNFLLMRTELHQLVSRVFRTHGVQVGLPQRMIWQGLPPVTGSLSALGAGDLNRPSDDALLDNVDPTAGATVGRLGLVGPPPPQPPAEPRGASQSPPAGEPVGPLSAEVRVAASGNTTAPKRSDPA